MSSQQPSSHPGSNPTTLKATYTSAQNPPFTLTQHLSLPETTPPTQQQKSAYLHSLRKSASAIQEQINKELTQRMEEDKARESNGVDGSKSVGAKKKSVVIDDEAEEENYGEEVVEDSD